MFRLAWPSVKAEGGEALWRRIRDEPESSAGDGNVRDEVGRGRTGWDRERTIVRSKEVGSGCGAAGGCGAERLVR